MWHELVSSSDIQEFLRSIDAFSDGSLRELHVRTPGMVADTTALLLFRDLTRASTAVEIKCERVSLLRVKPSQPGYDSVIMDGSIVRTGKLLTLSVNFVGGPMKGPPGGSIDIPARDFADPDITVSCNSIAWRPAEVSSSVIREDQSPS